MEQAEIIKYGSVDGFRRGNGVLTRLLVGKGNAESTIFTSGTTVFPAGTSAPMHSHNCSEQVTILEGEAECTAGGKTVRLSPYDTTFIPADMPHRFLNVGTGDLTILWIYGARDVTRTFTETGETVAHLTDGDQV
ncbi:MAG TPA: cupin domain-containing protein [Afifellaceae bacterium]|nr:cupin domain-containing protein [Afifellaceae bacterium]